VYETWSAGLCWFFIVTGGVFLIGIVGFMVAGTEESLTKYKERVGAIYENIDYSKNVNRLVPLVFITKRVLFAASCWYLKMEL
jgi:hypothetical protein